MSKTVLMIATCNFLAGQKDGGRQCSYRNYQMLCQIFGQENVSLSMFSDEKASGEKIRVYPTYHTKVQQVWQALGLRSGYSLKTEQELIKQVQAEEYDYIWLDRSTLGGLCPKIRTKAKVITFFHNVEKQYIKNKIRHENIGFVLTYPAFSYNEYCSVKYSDIIVCLNERDSKLLEKEYHRKADLLLPISFADQYGEQEKSVLPVCAEKKKELLFVGSYFQPNLEGMEWFINHVMEELPDVELKIVGKGLEKKKAEWTRKNVVVYGTVDDVSTYYQNVAAVVLPIFYGDGMKVKTAEALMYGKTIFATGEALEGYEIKTSPDVYECNCADEFRDNIRSFFSGTDQRSFSEINRKLFLDKYETTSLANRFRDHLKKEDTYEQEK